MSKKPKPTRSSPQAKTRSRRKIAVSKARSRTTVAVLGLKRSIAKAKSPKKVASPGSVAGRDNFSAAVLRQIANEVGNLCSNPGCGAPTSGPSRSRGASNVGTGAHITAAAQGGPRYDASLSNDERKSSRNAVWLCGRCGRLVDNDDTAYTVHGLQDWKATAIARAHRALETGRVPRPGPSKKSIDHDRAVFVRSNDIMGEQELRSHLDRVLMMAALVIDSDEFTRDWAEFFALEGNQYLIPALRSSCQETRSALRAFGNFVSLNFFLRTHETKIYLRPQLNIDLDGTGDDDDMQAFDRYHTEMLFLGNAILHRYTTYRRVVKEHLFL